jgi:hypothetical protein
MGSSLRDIPGAGGGRRKRTGLGKIGGGPASKPWQPPPKIQNPGKVPGRRRTGPDLRFKAPRVRIDRFNLVLALAFLGLFVAGGLWLLRSNHVTIDSGDFGDGDAVTTARLPNLEIDLNIEPHSRVEAATVRFEGEDVTNDLESTPTGYRWTPPSTGLEPGEYELEVSVPKAVFGTATFSMTFGVDDTPPVLEVDPPGRVGIRDELTVTGTVDERVDLVAGRDQEVAVDEDGHFSITFETPPAGAVELVATDPAGNATSATVPVVVSPPATRGAYVSVDGWEDDAVRESVLGLLDDGEIDSVVLDAKDECGVVTYDSGVDLAAQVGAVDARLDLEDAIDTIHDHDGQVIARVVTFRDPMLARWGWANGHQDWVLQDTAHDPWPEYGDGEGCREATNAPMIGGGFTDFGNGAVAEYNAAIAAEVAGMGADNVLVDDVRRPGGDLANMNVVANDISMHLTDFLDSAHAAVRAEGAYLGASISGLSVRDPATYGQDLAAFGPSVDYLAPEVYPESYGSGYFNLPDPQAQPGPAVQGAVQAASDQLTAADPPLATPLVPWLQDYTSSIPYGQAEVQAQVDGAGAAGACSWILRDPELTFTTGLTAAC